MPAFSGRKIAYGVGRETTRGTAVAPGYWIPHLDGDFKPRHEKALNDSALNVLNKYNDSATMKQWGEGSLEAKVQDDSFGLILAAVLGLPVSAAKAAPNAAVYDHTFNENQSNTGVSLSVVKKDPVSDLAFANSMIRSLEIRFEVGEFVKFTAEFVGKKGAAATSTVAYLAANEFKPKHISFKEAANTAGIAGATALPIRSGRVTIDRAVDPYFVVGTDDPNEIFAKEVEITGDFVLRYEDETHRNLVFGDGHRAVEINMVNTDVVIGSSANPALKLTMPKVALHEWDTDQGRDAIVEQTVGFNALFDIATAKAITAVLTNLVAAY